MHPFHQLQYILIQEVTHRNDFYEDSMSLFHLFYYSLIVLPIQLLDPNFHKKGFQNHKEFLHKKLDEKKV